MQVYSCLIQATIIRTEREKKIVKITAMEVIISQLPERASTETRLLFPNNEDKIV